MIVEAEEWEAVPVGAGQVLTRPDVELLSRTFRAYTGKDAGDFFDFATTWIKPKNWLGTLASGRVVLQVVPRGAKSLSAVMRTRLDENVGTIIRIAMERDVVRLGGAEFSTAASHFERGVEALCDLVLTARRRRILRTYSVHREESPALRGRLRFPEQTLLGLERPGVFASEWADLDENDPISRFLKGALELLKLRVSGHVRQRVEGALAELDGVPQSDLSLRAPAAGWRSRIPHEYGQAVDLAEELLEGRGIGLLAGSTHARTEIVLTPRVFERFVERLTREAAAAVGLSARFKETGRFLGKWASGPSAGALASEVVPDVELRSPDGKTNVLVDAKWKQLQPDRPGLGVVSGDLYQMLAYSMRLGCRDALLVYPWTGVEPPFAEPPSMLLRLSGASLRVTIVALPLLWSSLDEILSELRRPIAAAVELAAA